jgi:hypothetical protein
MTEARQRAVMSVARAALMRSAIKDLETELLRAEQ